MPRILLIDDDAAIRGITRRILERAGYEVLEAGDGEAGTRPISGGSGAGLGDLSAVANALGAVRTLGKPFGQSELLDAVQSVVGRAAGTTAE